MTNKDIREAIDIRLEGIILEAEPMTPRETVINCLDDACDDAWRHLVQIECFIEYTVDDFTYTARWVAEIIWYAKAYAWVEDDSSLWKGMTYGLPACIAYHSLRNCFYQALVCWGYDTNDDFPFAERG
jgi:hypothetical protein